MNNRFFNYIKYSMVAMITKPRGTNDYFYQLDPSLDILIDFAKKLAHLNGYYEVVTPIFEHKELFVRSVGNTSDIVEKEMYEFRDKSDRSLALRPEMTAPVCRCIVENDLLMKMIMPIKVFYVGPMFRYERPQSGRSRQFYQFGIECIGSNSYLDVVEIVNFALSFLQIFHYNEYILKINNICGYETRKKWIIALKKYFSKYKSKLSIDSQRRLDKNPLRILDDKIDREKDFVKKAPKIVDFATKNEIDYFKKITNIFDQQKIKYVIDNTLVRGLDYYCNFIFEIESTSKLLKGQPTIIGGGQYNTLLKELGGNETNCIGFAIGLERLIVALTNNQIFEKQKEMYLNIDVVVAPLEEKFDLYALSISNCLKQNAISSLTKFGTNKLEKHFKYAQKQKAKFVIIFGEKEIKKNVVLVKNQNTRQQEEVELKNLIPYLYEKLGWKNNGK